MAADPLQSGIQGTELFNCDFQGEYSLLFEEYNLPSNDRCFKIRHCNNLVTDTCKDASLWPVCSKAFLLLLGTLWQVLLLLRNRCFGGCDVLF